MVKFIIAVALVLVVSLGGYAVYRGLTGDNDNAEKVANKASELVGSVADTFADGAKDMAKSVKSAGTEAGTNWGINLDQESESRIKTKKAAMERQAEEERLARQQANIDKEYEDKSYKVKNWIYENIIPVGKIEKKEDQIDIANFIRNPRLNLTEADRKELLDRVYRDETQQESLRKAGQEAAVKKTGEKVGQDIDERRKKKDLADTGRKAIAAGRRLTRAQQKAIDEGY